MFCRKHLAQYCTEFQRGGFVLNQRSAPSRRAGSRIVSKMGPGYAGARAMTSRSRNPFEDENSIFSPKESAWDHIFEDEGGNPLRKPPPSAPEKQTVRRQTMTESERAIIRQMLDEVIQTKQSLAPDVVAKATSMLNATGSPHTQRLKLKHFRRMNDMEKDPETRLILDEMKQAIDLCPTKTDLLQWAQSNVFSILNLDQPSAKEHAATTKQLHIFQQLIPYLMRRFREHFNDPNLALFIFNAVRYNSVQSYVYGCSAMAYNELIIILWDSFRDLQGVRDVLQEMLQNSFESTSQTEALAERITREAMEKKLWLDRTEEGDQEALTALSNISDLLIELAATKSSMAGRWGRLKRDIIQKEGEED